MEQDQVNATFETIKTLLLKSIREYGCEAELSLCFSNKPYTYMIIIYETCCTFQRCDRGMSGEDLYDTLDGLYQAQLIDGIVLKRDWAQITQMDCCDFDMLGLW